MNKSKMQSKENLKVCMKWNSSLNVESSQISSCILPSNRRSVDCRNKLICCTRNKDWEQKNQKEKIHRSRNLRMKFSLSRRKQLKLKFNCSNNRRFSNRKTSKVEGDSWMSVLLLLCKAPKSLQGTSPNQMQQEITIQTKITVATLLNQNIFKFRHLCQVLTYPLVPFVEKVPTCVQVCIVLAKTIKVNKVKKSLG